MDNNINQKGAVAAEYENMKQDRQPYLTKAKLAAKYTIPSLITDVEKKYQNIQQIETPNQSVGADGVNNLASKVTMVMLPPNQTFFKFAVDDLVLKEEAPDNTNQYKDEVNKGLAKVEKLLIDYQESLGDRVCLGEALKHLYVTGNTFMIHDPKEGLKYYPLDRFCIKRDYCGNVLIAITEETVNIDTLPNKIREAVKLKVLAKKAKVNEKNKNHSQEDDVVLYTKFERTEKGWKTSQEVEGIEIPDAKGSYPLDVCPFIALRYVRIDGESYGRGLIEEYIGDISYLDTLSLAIKQASLAASKFIMLVNPTGVTKIKHIAEAKNGGFALGRADDVTPLQANKYYDLQVAQAECDKIERRLNRIFVMKAAIQRDAERVTAEEIRQMAQDLEEALGNHYAIMCKEFQLAYVKISFHHLRKTKHSSLPNIISDKNIHLTVTTGIEALGRSSELNKLITFLDIMGKLAPSAQPLGCKIDAISEKVATSLNLDIDGLFYSEEEKAQMQQQAQQQELMAKAAPNFVNKAGDMMMQQQQQEQQ